VVKHSTQNITHSHSSLRNKEEGCSEGFVNMKYLVCGVPCTLDAYLLGALEDGLNALLNIEIRASKLQNRASAPPPLQAENLPHGVLAPPNN